MHALQHGSAGKAAESGVFRMIDQDTVRVKRWDRMRMSIVSCLVIGNVLLAGSALANLPESSCTNLSDSWTSADRSVLKEINRLRTAYKRTLIKVKGMKEIAACSIEEAILEHLLVDEDYTDDSQKYFECVLNHYSKFC